MISVCMATYNGAKFIKQQIDSILYQLGMEDELIISDDGSTDKTLNIIASYNDSRIKVFHHKRNPNFAKIKYSRSFYYATANFENALIHAKGDYIFLADQDDIWLEKKVATCVEALKEYDFIIHSKTQKNNENLLSSNVVTPRNWFFHLMHMTWYGCCMAFRKKLLKMVLPFPKKLIGHDYWISVIALRFCSVKVINTPLIAYRLHENSVSQGTKNPLAFKIFFRIKLLFSVIKRFIQLQLST